MKLLYGADGEGNLVVTADDETILGTFVQLNMGDDTGMDHLMELARFYQAKGYNVRRVIANYLQDQEQQAAAVPAGRGLVGRIKAFFGR